MVINPMKAIEQYVSLELLAKRDNDKKAHNGEETVQSRFHLNSPCRFCARNVYAN